MIINEYSQLAKWLFGSAGQIAQACGKSLPGDDAQEAR